MSLDITNPELIKEWDEEKNGLIRNYTKGSKIKMWWICEKDSHHSWTSSIYNRAVRKRNCHICTNRIICPIDQCNSLYNNCSEKLKREWDKKNNGSMKNYLFGSGKKVWWICSINNHHQWEVSIWNRINDNRNCPICVNQIICPIDQCNSLYYNCSEKLKQEWNEKKNGSMKNYTLGSNKKVWWICSINSHHQWKSSIYNRLKNETNCAICTNKLICSLDQCN